MAKQKKEFMDGALNKGIDRKTAGDIFDLIEKFASYGFNKSHSVAYSVLAYQTAYLKAHYPAEYMAATMTSEVADTDKIVVLTDDCRKLGIPVLPPDVNEGNVTFVVTQKSIRFGLSAIKNVGVSAVEAIVRSRDEKGPFVDIFDFCARVDLHIVNKKTLEGLIQAGAFDSLHSNRAQLFEAVEKAIGHGQNVQEHSGKGQSNLFETSSAKIDLKPSLPLVDARKEPEILAREKAALGFYLSGHPLDKFREEIEAFAQRVARHCLRLQDEHDGEGLRHCRRREAKNRQEGKYDGICHPGRLHREGRLHRVFRCLPEIFPDSASGINGYGHRQRRNDRGSPEDSCE